MRVNSGSGTRVPQQIDHLVIKGAGRRSDNRRRLPSPLAFGKCFPEASEVIQDFPPQFVRSRPAW